MHLNLLYCRLLSEVGIVGPPSPNTACSGASRVTVVSTFDGGMAPGRTCILSQFCSLCFSLWLTGLAFAATAVVGCKAQRSVRLQRPLKGAADTWKCMKGSMWRAVVVYASAGGDQTGPQGHVSSIFQSRTKCMCSFRQGGKWGRWYCGCMWHVQCTLTHVGCIVGVMC